MEPIELFYNIAIVPLIVWEALMLLTAVYYWLIYKPNADLKETTQKETNENNDLGE